MVKSENLDSTTKINNIRDETTTKPAAQAENLGMKLTLNTTSLPLNPKSKTKIFPNSKNKLRDQLLENYDKVSHPVKNHTKAVVVEVGMAVIHLGQYIIIIISL